MARRSPWWFVLVVVLWLVACGPAGPGGGDDGGGGGGGGVSEATLMIPTANTIQVINGPLDAMARRVPLRLSDGNLGFLTCGPMATGPGGRLYVAALSSFGVGDAPSAIAVFEPAAVGGGARTPVAVLYAPDRFFNVCGVAFDQNGTLWTVNNDPTFSDREFGDTPSEVVGIRGLTGTETGAIDLTTRTPALASFDLDLPGLGNLDAYDVRVDGNGSLWLLSQTPDALVRFDTITSVTTGGQSVSPSYVLTPNVFASLPAFSSAVSMAVDGSGNVYVATRRTDVVATVSRFDGAGTRTGRDDDAQPDAFLFLDDIDGQALLVAIDAQGRLWAASDAKVARFGAAASMPGNVPQSPAYVITYVVDGQTNFAGGMTFVPVPPGLGF